MNATRIEIRKAEGEAKGIRAKGDAEASRILAIGESTAKAYELQNKAVGQQGVTAIAEFLTRFPECTILATCRRHQNHGHFTVGHSVDEAVWWFVTMERSCQAQLLAEAAGTPKHIPVESARYTRQHAEDAFAEIVRRHLDLVFSAALRQVRSPQLAEEVAQSAFTDLARNAAKLTNAAGGSPVLTAWLYQVTRRTAIDVVRRESRRQLREQIATEMNAMNANAADWTHIEPLLDEAVSALDDTDRAAVLLRYFENKSLREVGQTLGTTEDAAQKRVSRAVERLREFFAKRGVTVGASGLAAVAAFPGFRLVIDLERQTVASTDGAHAPRPGQRASIVMLCGPCGVAAGTQKVTLVAFTCFHSPVFSGTGTVQGTSAAASWAGVSNDSLFAFTSAPFAKRISATALRPSRTAQCKAVDPSRSFVDAVRDRLPEVDVRIAAVDDIAEQSNLLAVNAAIEAAKAAGFKIKVHADEFVSQGGAELAAEIALHRRLLAGSRTLVTKMIMRRAVQRDLQAPRRAVDGEGHGAEGAPRAPRRRRVVRPASSRICRSCWRSPAR